MSLPQSVRRWNHHRIDLMKSIALGCVRGIFDSRSQFLKEGQASKNILVLRLDDKIGDSITATGFLRELKKQFPTHRLTVLAGAGTAAVYRHSPSVDEVIIARKGFFSTLSLFARLRRQTYRSIINTSHILSPRVVFLCSQLQAENKISFLSDSYRLFSKHIQYDPLGDHISLRYQKTLESLGSGSCDLSYFYVVAAEASEKVRRLLREKKIPAFLVLNSFAGSRMRSLNQQTTTSVVRGLLQTDPDLHIVSIGNSNDLPLARKWQAESGLDRWHVFPEVTDFAMNAAFIEQSRLVITPDTALVHLASALKKPLVAIYREDAGGMKERNTRIWAPYGTLYKMILSPNDQSPDPDINLVDVSKIIHAAQELLALPPSPEASHE